MSKLGDGKNGKKGKNGTPVRYDNAKRRRSGPESWADVKQACAKALRRGGLDARGDLSRLREAVVDGEVQRDRSFWEVLRTA